MGNNNPVYEVTLYYKAIRILNKYTAQYFNGWHILTTFQWLTYTGKHINGWHKQDFVWSNCIVDHVACLLICDVLCIRYVEESSVASYLHCLYSALKVGGECPGFACMPKDRYHGRTHQMDLWSKIDDVVFPDYFQTWQCC